MTNDIEGRLKQALAAFQGGDAVAAERTCADILQSLPDHASALHLLGLIDTALGRFPEAVARLTSAARVMPGNPAVHVDLGFALTRQGRHGDAAASFTRALALDPANPGVHLNLGNALAEQGRAEEALACYRKMLELGPGLGIAHFSIGRLHERVGRLDQALVAYQAAQDASPRNTDVLHSLGSVYQKLGRIDAAMECYRKVLALDPAHAPSLNNLGTALIKQGRGDEAAPLFERALAARPDDSLACINLGKLRAEQRRYDEARALYEKAAILEPDDPAIFINLGTMLAAQQQWEAAKASYERALELDPSSPDASYNHALVRLFQLDFSDAWRGYELRLKCPSVRKTLRKGAWTLDRYDVLTRWQGPGEAGVGEVAIWAEQGIGDQMLFSTLIPELVTAGVPFIYEVDPRLMGAYQRAFPGARFIALSKPPLEVLQKAQRVLLAGSLPALFRASRADFERQPAHLLAALPERVAQFRSRLDARGPGPKIALSWRSKNSAGTARLKSAALMEFAPLLKVPGMQFVDVQYGDTRVERRWAEEATGTRLAHFDDVDYYNGLEDLLAILEACDLLVTTSNATAHFAGALGKRTWLLFTADRAPFYYWAHGGSRRSLWYPSVEIVTAPQLDEWAPLMAHAAAKLGRELA